MGLIIGPPLIIHSGGGGGNKDKWLDPVSAEFTRRTSGGSLSVGNKAKISSVKGRTLVWNQMVKNGDFGTGDLSNWNTSSPNLTAVVNNGVCEITKSASGGMYMSQRINLVEGHKYFLSCDLKAYNNKVSVFIRDATADEYYCRTSISSDFDKFHRIREVFVSVGSNTKGEIRFNDTNTSDFQTYYVKNVMFIDLTLLGLDYLETAEDFAKLFPDDYYPSTYTGSNYATFTPYLVNNIASAIKTIGFNQWDEQWEVGGIYTNTGGNSTTAGYYRNAGYINVLPASTYYIKAPAPMTLFFYDKSKSYLGCIEKKDTSFVVPDGAFFMRFRNGNANTWTPYNNDICINFSCSRNGEYESYWSNTLPLGLTTLTGKLNGEGTSVTIFPDGMKSVGSVYDELTETTATKRIGSQVVSGSTGDTITLVGCDTSAVSYTSATDIGSLSNGILTLTEDVSDVTIHFALAAPESYTLDSPLSLSYKVDSFGTEERLPADTPSELTAPIRIEVSYKEPKAKDMKPTTGGLLSGLLGSNDETETSNETEYETDS